MFMDEPHVAEFGTTGGTTTTEFKQFRMVIYKRDAATCISCDQTTAFDLSKCEKVDKNGDYTSDNVFTFCSVCACLKPDFETEDEFFDWLREGAALKTIREVLEEQIGGKLSDNKILEIISRNRPIQSLMQKEWYIHV